MYNCYKIYYCWLRFTLYHFYICSFLAVFFFLYGISVAFNEPYVSFIVTFNFIIINKFDLL